MHCFATAIILAIVLIAAAIDLRVILSNLADFRSIIAPDLPPLVRRLLWQQYAWVCLPVRKVGGLLFWLTLAFMLACQLAPQVMAA